MPRLDNAPRRPDGWRSRASAISFVPARVSRALIPLAAFAIPLAVFLWGWRYVGSGDTRPAELIPIALLRGNGFDLTPLLDPTEAYPYWYVRIGGRAVSAYPILPGLLNTPAFAIADAAGVDLFANRIRLSMISAAVISALSVLFLYLCLDRLCGRRAAAFALAMVYAFGTCVWSVTSRGMWQHGPSLLFLTAAVWLLIGETPSSIAWSGFFLGLAIVNRPTNVLIAVPLAVLVALRWRRSLAAFLALGAIPLALRAIYSWTYWGSPFSLGQRSPFPEVANFGGRPLEGLAGLLISPSRGLLVFSPFLLFGLLAVRRSWRRRGQEPLPIALGVGALAVLLVTSKWTMWWGGHSFGYRLVIEMLPALMIFVALAWEGEIRARPALKAAFLISCAWSIGVHALGSRYQPSGFDARMDRDPSLLWSVRGSEIEMSARKALGELGLSPSP